MRLVVNTKTAPQVQCTSERTHPHTLRDGRPTSTPKQHSYPRRTKIDQRRRDTLKKNGKSKRQRKSSTRPASDAFFLRFSFFFSYFFLNLTNSMGCDVMVGMGPMRRCADISRNFLCDGDCLGLNKGFDTGQLH